MSATGFNDAQKLADAIALARSFKSGESSNSNGKKRGRVASPGTLKGNRRCPGVWAPDPAPPPPSKRNYDGLGRFGVPAQDINTQPIIGTVGFDFLRRLDAAQRAKADEGSATCRSTVDAPVPTATNIGAAQTGGNGPAAASNMTLKASDKKNEPNLNAMINSLNFEEQKPDGTPTGTMLDTFFSLVSSQDTAEEGIKPEESTDYLIDFAEGGNAVPVTIKRKPSFEMDWVGSQASSKSAAPATEVSALPSWDLGRLDEFPATSDGILGIPAENKLCARAQDFVPAKATAPNSNSQISAVAAINPVQNTQWNAQSYGYDAVIQAPLISTAGVAPFGSWLDPVATGVVPLMAYAILVPIAAFVPAQATHHTSPQTFQVADPLGSTRQVNYISSQAKPGKKPAEGLKSSMWAS